MTILGLCRWISYFIIHTILEEYAWPYMIFDLSMLNPIDQPCWSLILTKTTHPEILPLTTQKSSPSQPRNPPPHNPPFIQLLPILPLTTQKSSPSKPSLHQTSSKQYTQVLTWHIPGLTLNGSSLTWHVHSFTWHSPSFNWQVFSLAQHFLTLT